MAKFDQGGGCPCGLKKVCGCEYENSRTIVLPQTLINNAILPWLQAAYGKNIEIVKPPYLEIMIKEYDL